MSLAAAPAGRRLVLSGIDRRTYTRLLLAFAEHPSVRLKAGRSSTFRWRAKRRGLEPDNSYWIATEPLAGPHGHL